MGLRVRVGTRDQLFNLRIIMEKSREYGVPIYMAFVDYRKAFDSISHRRLWEVLNRIGISRKTVTALKSLYEHQKATVKADNEMSDWFKIGKGVRQGCVISPVLFNLYSEEAMRHSVDVLGWNGVSISGRTLTL